MSPAIATERNPTSSNGQVGWRHAPARPQRTAILADRLAMHIESLVPRGRAECLDMGCSDPTLAEHVQERLPRANWQRIDVQQRRFDGRTFCHGDGDFDVALLCDALCRPRQDAARLLVEAGRVARHVLVKDRFGNQPAEQYFTQESFGRLVTEQGLVITALDCGLDRCRDWPVAPLFEDPWPFIAVLRRA
jgi:hypothetical protein